MLQQKWSYLKIKYKNEIALETHFPEYKSSWYLYKHMTFLQDHFQKVLKIESTIKKVQLSHLKVQYLTTLLQEIRNRPKVWISLNNPTEEESCEIEGNWEEIKEVIEQTRKFL